LTPCISGISTKAENKNKKKIKSLIRYFLAINATGSTDVLGLA